MPGNIERLCSQNPNFRKEAIIKIEALRLGLHIKTETEKAALAKAMTKAWSGEQHIYSKDWTQSRIILPMYFSFLTGGVCAFRHNPNSPYSIDLLNDRYMFCENQVPLMEVAIPEAHPLYYRKLSDGTPLPSVLDNIIGDGALICVLNVCFWEKCAFCDMTSHASILKKKPGMNFIIHKDPELVGEAFALCVKEANVSYINITGGTIIGHYRGKTDTDFYVEYLEAMGKRVEFPRHYAIALAAKSKEDLKRIHATGIKIIGMNLEVWDPALFAILCPGKNKFIGREAWIQSLVDAVDVFGAGNVVTNFVAGVEMCQPYGFTDVNEALKSTLSGYEYLMQRGIVPRQDYWCVESGTRLGGSQQPPPSEFFVRLTRGCYELLGKYGLPPSPFFNRATNAIDPIHDLYD
ncbi:MAG: hypothetical protein HY670_02410 [Chloroflexi bacterium]|nr:hypothetical protein [Chloroflexota bacterium]